MTASNYKRFAIAVGLRIEFSLHLSASDDSDFDKNCTVIPNLAATSGGKGSLLASSSSAMKARDKQNKYLDI